MNLVVLGAGPGGYVAALRAAQLGAEVTVIEKHEVGGTCLNWGCIPTKTLLSSSEVYSRAKDLDTFGIELSCSPSPNMAKILERKNRVVETQVKGIRSLLKNRDIELKIGQGTFLSPREVSVTLRNGTRETIAADAFVIATGSRPAQIPALPFDGVAILSSTEALELREIPRSLIIIGAGAIGCEFATIFGAFGADVTMVELLPRVAPMEDEAVSKILERELKKRKIRVITGASVERAVVQDGNVRAMLSGGKTLSAEKILVSIGRAYNSDDLGLEKAGVATGPKKEILVSASMQTNVPAIYAVGDVTGGILLAHAAAKQGIVAAENIMGANTVFDDRAVPSAIFTTPEVASVGLREHAARDRGISITTGEFPFRSLGKAHAMGEIAGFIKVIADAKTDRILGAHIIGPHASDLIHEFAIAMRAGLGVRDIADTIHAHPTLAEGIVEACEDVHDTAIHVPGKQ